MGEDLEPQLLQLRFRDEPWKLLVACILLNRTQRAQVDRVIDDLFLDYPTPQALADARESDLRDLLYPLGMSRTRAQRLILFAQAWLAAEHMTFFNERQILRFVGGLPGVGKYALDSYRIFVLGERDVDADDKELRRWLRWSAKSYSSG